MGYKKHENRDDNGNLMSVYIFDTERGCYIPPDPDNSDYAAYLKWVAAGNTPEEAD
tara:strand:+ start:656 stop:823 length:168 start_codon:yes stop_codon:yes gene_type:complete